MVTMSRSELESILEGLIISSSGLLKSVYCNLLNNLKSNTRTKITTSNDLRLIKGFTKPILEDIALEQLRRERGSAEEIPSPILRVRSPSPAPPDKPQSPDVHITPPPASPPPTTSSQTISAHPRKSSKKNKRLIQRKKGRTRYTRGFISESSESSEASFSSESSDGNTTQRMTGNVCHFNLY